MTDGGDGLRSLKLGQLIKVTDCSIMYSICVDFCEWLLAQDSDDAENDDASSDDDYSATRKKDKRRRKTNNVS